MTGCPYCDANAERTVGWYFDCDNGHTFHIDDWSSIEFDADPEPQIDN